MNGRIYELGVYVYMEATGAEPGSRAHLVLPELSQWTEDYDYEYDDTNSSSNYLGTSEKCFSFRFESYGKHGASILVRDQDGKILWSQIGKYLTRGKEFFTILSALPCHSPVLLIFQSAST